MAAYTPFVRCLINEASSGTVPTVLVDDTGNGNNLAIDYSSGDAEFTVNGAGKGINFTATANTANTAIAQIVNVKDNGNIGASMAGATQICCIFLCNALAGHSNAMRAIALGTIGGNTDFSIIKRQADIYGVRWDYESGGVSKEVGWTMTPNDGSVVVVRIDTTQAVTTDRCKVWLDGVSQSLTSNNLPLNSSIQLAANSTDRIFSLGNRGDQSRNTQGIFYYLEIGTGVPTDQQIIDISTNIAADNDSNWDSGGDTSINAGLESISLASLQATIASDKDIAVALESLTVTTAQATVQANIDTDIGSAQESITLTANQALIQSDIDSQINAALESILLSTNQATVQANVDSDVNASLESISIIPHSANTNISSGLNVAAESITLSTFLAEIYADVDTALSGSLETISLTANPASIVTGSDIAAATESIQLQSLQASVIVDTAISAQMQSIVLTELAAQVDLASEINTQLESLTITTLGTTIELSSGISATLESLTLSSFQATITSPIAAILAPGLEYTISGKPLHYSFPLNKIHFTFRS